MLLYAQHDLCTVASKKWRNGWSWVKHEKNCFEYNGVLYMKKAEIYCDESDLKTYEQEEHCHTIKVAREKKIIDNAMA